MLTVGLTGGIASGKSHVTEILKELGCDVIDADQVARQVVEPGQPAYREIVDQFGNEVLLSGGGIDRPRLGALVFADPEKMKRLNAIVHPRVHQIQEGWLEAVRQRNPEAVAVVDAALMIESGGYKRFDKLVVVYCSPEIQLVRLMKRNNLTTEEARMRVSAQLPAAEKLKFADYSIDTSGSFEATRDLVLELFSELKKQEVSSRKMA